MTTPTPSPKQEHEVATPPAEQPDWAPPPDTAPQDGTVATTAPTQQQATPPMAAAPSVPLAQPAPTRPNGRRPTLLDAFLVAAAVVAIAGVGFAAGRLTAPSARDQLADQFRRGAVPIAGGGSPGGQLPNGGLLPGGNVQPGDGQNGTRIGLMAGGGLALQGEVTEVASDHLSLKLEGGQTITIGLASGTTYHQQAPASAADVTTGDTVVVRVDARGALLGQGGGQGAGRLGDASDVTIVNP